MKLKDFAKAIQKKVKMYGNREVVFSSDPEGNSFGLLGKKPRMGFEGKEFFVVWVDEVKDLDDMFNVWE